jgi:uncharacterized alkaline shock family protein YloU
VADTMTPPAVQGGTEAARSAATLGDPGNRGALTVHDKVVERLASRAALETAGVHRHGAGIGKLTGRDLPRVHVQISGDRVRAGVHIAVAWAWPLPTVVADVQANVAHALTAWAGLHVDAVDVSVPAVVNPDDATPRPRVQ